ncbi:SpaA isopeptide-forming pilin-related protein [Streptococcus sp. R4]|uniref:SpaA isopeptide-forming pilin-related protein n=1 Tax=Streptococcus TaxID=1301 RepID=UPI0009A1BF98|nr:SpaA isopeptide-forming pilin-related protein [Streptococcus agalactiae]MEE3843135.1 SpaA isopeptide-forming pilin-related protein [Streptococcus sp. R4]MEB3018620.1 SpaA isopeptide-forming pilin-related protein [Streptococcus agalactiae]MEC3712667.1 SpaA isopeptide-forming pilin-related protein [Streptococcus agalactiae]WPG04243.1 SpaA isopeptide-forming pilin-related protein [Streptococcus agalactiae]WPG07836.1 SpaA isopeptide-forming pilin-related protein [Streptococcus agalactiae]
MKKRQKIWRELSVTLLILSQIPFGILVQGETQDTNQALGKVIVKKTGDNATPLGKATFVLKNDNDKSETSHETVEGSGEATFENIKPGDYTLREETAPIGYKKTDKTWKVKVADNGATIIEGMDADKAEKRKEVLNAQYPKSAIYEDTKENYPLVNVEGSKVGEQYKALNPINGKDGRREIAEGWLSKKITGVNDLDKNKYKIELTVEGKTTVETKELNQPLDVVVLLDNSNSMNNERANNSQRALKAGEAVEKLIDKITSNKDNRVALVTYASTIFDGTEATVSKGVADQNGKALNDSVSWDYHKTTFTATTHNYSYLNLTNDANEVNILKSRIPKEAEHINGDRTLYQFGATFTQKALMKANEILETQSSNARKKLIFHVTDGVPTMSYAINFNPYISTSYQNQFNSFLNKIPDRSGILQEDFIINGDDYKIVKGDGESFKLFSDRKVPVTGGTTQAAYRVPQNQLSVMSNEGYAINSGYIYLYWRDYNWVYPFDPKTKKVSATKQIKTHGEPTTLYFNGNIRPKGYDIFTVGIGVNGDPGATPLEAEKFMQSISSKTENYTNVDDTNKIYDELNKYFKTIVEEKHSIVDGNVTDPMGEMIDFPIPKIRDVREFPVLTISNQKKMGEVEFIKVNKDKHSESLLGAKFQLQIEKDFSGYKQFVPEGSDVTTKNDGKIYFKALQDGNYKLYEISSPDGYIEVKTKPVVTFTIQNGEVTNLKADPNANKNQIGYLEENGKHLITNTPKRPPGVFPKTGGIGTIVCILVGSTFMILTICSFRRKQL